ncbi:MAG TPA: hypothetical protein VH137_04430, partial [Gemmatimonadales bacterium]|nr:hypothetical protein [Gemmatimonadales bacterium]
MRLEIVAAPPPSPLDGRISIAPIDAPTRPEDDTRPHPHWPQAAEVLNVFLEGPNNDDARIDAHVDFVLRDLALTLVDLAAHPYAKGTVRACDAPWELCVERFVDTACLSVYRTGPEPLVAVYDRAVPFADVVVATRAVIERRLVSRETRIDERGSRATDARGLSAWESTAHTAELSSALTHLLAIGPLNAGDSRQPAALPARVPVVVEPDRDAPVSFGAEFAIRDRARWEHPSDGAGDVSAPRGQAQPDPRAVLHELVERSDMHALLFRGRIR